MSLLVGINSSCSEVQVVNVFEIADIVENGPSSCLVRTHRGDTFYARCPRAVAVAWRNRGGEGMVDLTQPGVGPPPPYREPKLVTPKKPKSMAEAKRVVARMNAQLEKDDREIARALERGTKPAKPAKPKRVRKK